VKRDLGEVIISSKVFVGNLSYDTTQDELQSLFSEVGQVVEVFLPNDRSTGRPRGFAFVQFAEQANAAQAIEKFDGHQLKGRNISVRQAEERQRQFSDSPDAGRSSTPRGSRGSKPKGSRRNSRLNLRDRKGSF